MTTIVSFLIVISILIFIHELGHFLVAKGIGVRVEKFSLGFGPRILGFKRGDTEYLLSAFPLGGYVKLAGEDPDEEDLSEQPWSFSSRSVWERVSIVLAGPLMNVILAFVIMTVLFIIGVSIPEYLAQPAEIGYVEENSPAALTGLQPGDRIDKINGKSIPNWEWLHFYTILNADTSLDLEIIRDGQLLTKTMTPRRVAPYNSGYSGLGFSIPAIVGGVLEDSPAKRAGLLLGDEIIEINQEPISGWLEMSNVISISAGKSLSLTVKRGEQILTMEIVPELNEEIEKGRIGIAQKDLFVEKQYGLFGSIKEGGIFVAKSSYQFFYILGKLLSFKLSVKTLGGPIAIAQASGAAGKRSPIDLFAFLSLISVHLGLINLLPIPILDGGHILIFLTEGVRRKPWKTKHLEFMQKIGFAFIITLMLVVTYNDILRVWDPIREFFSGFFSKIADLVGR